MAALTALEQSQQPHTREERLAEGKQLLQEIKSMIAEMRQKLDEATAFVNTLDNKPHAYTEALAGAERSVVWQEDRTIPGAEEKITGIRINTSYEPSFQQLKDIRDAIRDNHAPSVNEILAPIFTVKELKQKVQEMAIKVAVMRDIRAEGNAIMAEAREFLKKWDEIPATYADPMKKAERVASALNTRFLDSDYEKFLNDPTNEFFRDSLERYAKSFPTHLDSIYELLETLLATARQQTEKEQCAQPDVECNWHTGNNNMTVSQYNHTGSDGADIVIDYYESGDIKKYTQYYPHTNKKELEINYRDPYNTGWFVNGVEVECNGKNWCKKTMSEKHYYYNGVVSRTIFFHSPMPTDSDPNAKMSTDRSFRTDGTQVYVYREISRDGEILRGEVWYPSVSSKMIITNNGNTVTCYADGGGILGTVEPCTPYHRIPEY